MIRHAEYWRYRVQGATTNSRRQHSVEQEPAAHPSKRRARNLHSRGICDCSSPLPTAVAHFPRRLHSARRARSAAAPQASKRGRLIAFIAPCAHSDPSTTTGRLRQPSSLERCIRGWRGWARTRSAAVAQRQRRSTKAAAAGDDHRRRPATRGQGPPHPLMIHGRRRAADRALHRAPIASTAAARSIAAVALDHAAQTETEIARRKAASARRRDLDLDRATGTAIGGSMRSTSHPVEAEAAAAADLSSAKGPPPPPLPLPPPLLPLLSPPPTSVASKPRRKLA